MRGLRDSWAVTGRKGQTDRDNRVQRRTDCVFVGGWRTSMGAEGNRRGKRPLSRGRAAAAYDICCLWFEKVRGMGLFFEAIYKRE